MPNRPVKLKVKVVPGASKSEIVGWLGDALKVRVSAPPERGKANAAVEKLICSALNLPGGRARVVAGHTSQRKVLELDDVNEDQILRSLDRPTNGTRGLNS